LERNSKNKNDMKKLLLLLFICSLSTAKADEGMWTLYNLPNAVYETMKQENYELPYGALYQGEDAIKNCVVNFGGYCSGVVVSLFSVGIQDAPGTRRFAADDAGRMCL
jgi:hypothetical protein